LIKLPARRAANTSDWNPRIRRVLAQAKRGDEGDQEEFRMEVGYRKEAMPINPITANAKVL